MTTEIEKLGRGERGEDPRALPVVMHQAATAAVPTRWRAPGTPLENAAG